MARSLFLFAMFVSVIGNANAWEVGPFKGDDPKIELPRLPNLPFKLPDVAGDLAHPERIWENAKREVGNVGREIDRIRLEFNAVTNAPLLAAWLQQSRNNAINGAMLIPAEIRQALGNFYDEDIYNRVRFKIGDGGAVNLANLSINYGEAGAVTLIDVVVFAGEQGAKTPSLWAHELKHIQQFRDWGVHDFSIRYIRSYNSVENDAYAAERQFINQYGAGTFDNPQLAPGTTQEPIQSQSPPLQWTPMPGPFPMSMVCGTQFGMCQTAGAFPRGSQCWCPAWDGQPIVGLMQ